MTTYKFQVFAENGVSDLVGEKSQYTEITVSTEATVVSTVINVKGRQIFSLFGGCKEGRYGQKAVIGSSIIGRFA